MIHTASLLHDDVVDRANTRRGNISANIKWGQRKPVLVGNLIMALASQELAKIKNVQIINILSIILMDLIHGELMQMGSKLTDNERFSHYLQKTFKKAGSLLANSCKCVALLSLENKEYRNNESVDRKLNLFYKFGKHIGMAFQIRDDILDFTGDMDKTGKNCGNKDIAISGLANAPLLFACEKFPYIEAIIMRRFSEPGDVEKALEAIKKSDGLKDTQNLVLFHAGHAKNILDELFLPLSKTDFDLLNLYNSLISMCDYIVTRDC
ncbi:unnamed protein product [Gordionus sp. m RMFG-2023]